MLESELLRPIHTYKKQSNVNNNFHCMSKHSHGINAPVDSIVQFHNSRGLLDRHVPSLLPGTPDAEHSSPVTRQWGKKFHNTYQWKIKQTEWVLWKTRYTLLQTELTLWAAEELIILLISPDSYPYLSISCTETTISPVYISQFVVCKRRYTEFESSTFKPLRA